MEEISCECQQGASSVVQWCRALNEDVTFGFSIHWVSTSRNAADICRNCAEALCHFATAGVRESWPFRPSVTAPVPVARQSEQPDLTPFLQGISERGGQGKLRGASHSSGTHGPRFLFPSNKMKPGNPLKSDLIRLVLFFSSSRIFVQFDPGFYFLLPWPLLHLLFSLYSPKCLLRCGNMATFLQQKSGTQAVRWSGRLRTSSRVQGECVDRWNQKHQKHQ